MASRPWEQPDRYIRALDSLARFYNSEKTVHAGYLITSFIAVMAFLSAAVTIVLSPTLGGLGFWTRILIWLIIAAITFACYFCINKPWPILFRYLLGRMQLYVCLSDIVWEHMGVKTSGEYADKLRRRTENPDINGIQDAVMTFFAARLYISICSRWKKYLQISEIEDEFSAKGLLRDLWPYESRVLRWKLADLLVLAHRHILQGYEKGGALHRRIFRCFADLGVVKRTSMLAAGEAGTRTMILIGGGLINDPKIDVFPLDKHEDYADFLKAATRKGWKILSVQGQKPLVTFYDEISSLAKGIHDKQKPILVGHSAGAVVALSYLKDRSRESWFEKTILFNCPLIYPRAQLPALRSCYQGTERVTADAQLIMSEYDDVIMPWSLDSIDMRKAIEIVQQTGKVQVQVVRDKPDYDHSPFYPINVAWEIIGKLPVQGVTPRVAMSLRFRRFKSLRKTLQVH